MKDAGEQGRQAVTIVIGGGVSGLAAAFELKNCCPQMQVRIIEKNLKAGGVINSFLANDALIECGPESFSTLKPELIELAKKLKIEKHIISCSSNSRRSFLCLDKSLHALPKGMMFFAPSNLYSFALSDIFSIPGKLRMSCDLVLPAKADDTDESLASFVSRRLGNEALEKLAEPMIGGIYGGDPELLSADSTVPQLVALEKKYGSVIRGLLNSQVQKKSAQASGPRYESLASFDRGISLLVSQLLNQLPPRTLIAGRAATHIRAGENGRRWTVVCDDNSLYGADFIILAAPAQVGAALLGEVNPVLADKLSRIQRSPAIILNLIYDRKQIKHALNGFGFVVPRQEDMLISACSFSSVKFEGRSNPEQMLLRVFTGGAQKIQSMSMTDLELVKQAHNELQKILGIERFPIQYFVTRHEQAIPQYLVGHKQLLKNIEADLHNCPGIEIAGNSYIGVGLPDCIRSARIAANNIVKQEKLQNSWPDTKVS